MVVKSNPLISKIDIMEFIDEFTKQENLSTFIVEKTIKIREIVPFLRRSKTWTLFVVDEDKRFIGSVSDADLRIFVSNGGDTDSTIINCTNISAKFLYQTELVELRELPDTLKKTLLFPVLNNEQRIIQIFEKSKQHCHILENAHLFILAGGRGLRLMPFTKDCPKPMLKVKGKPILEHILTNAYLHGIRKVTISLGYRGEIIKKHFQDGAEFGLEIDYVEEKEPLGTAGPLSKLELGEKQKIIVINGDLLTSCNLQSLVNFHNRWHADATICVKNIKHTYPYGIVKSANGIMTGFDEKPTVNYQINTGIYVLNEILLHELEQNKYTDMPNFLEKLKIMNKTINIFSIYEDWYDIGTPIDYEKINSEPNSWLT